MNSKYRTHAGTILYTDAGPLFRGPVCMQWPLLKSFGTRLCDKAEQSKCPIFGVCNTSGVVVCNVVSLVHHVLMFLAVSCTNGLCLWLQRYPRQVRRNGGSISSPWQPVSWTEFCPTTHRFSLYQTPPLYLQLINLPPSLLSPSSPHFLIFQRERPACLPPSPHYIVYIYSSTAFKITHTLFLTSIL